MKRPVAAIPSFILTVFLAACAPKNFELQSSPPGDPMSVKSEASMPVEKIPVRKVDILFVIDTSESMDVHQDRVKSHIAKFVGAFQSHADLDFHIGVISIWDSRTYSQPGRPTPHPMGLLRPLKDPGQPGVKIDGPQFVTRGPHFGEILGETLDLGVEHLKDGGPQWEEMFSPILPALTSQQNGDFYRADAQLAIIVLTDADDSSVGLTADQLRDQLFALKGGNGSTVSVYGIISEGSNCPVDPGRKNVDGSIRAVKNIARLIEETGGSIANLCDPNEDSFGRQLAKIGASIEGKVSPIARIRLRFRPDFPTLQVMYILPNGQTAALQPGEGFSFDEINNEVQVHGDCPLIVANPGGQVRISYKPIDSRQFKRGQVKRFGT